MKLAIQTFNDSHEDVQIEIRDYWGSDYEEALQGRNQLLTEINSGTVPDILDVGYNCWNVAMLPFRKLAEQGCLENLWPYIEKDPDLGREAVMEGPLKAAEMNGGLYLLFDSFKIETLVGPERIVGKRTSWTLADQREAFETMPADSTILDYVCGKNDVLEALFSMSLDDYINWETGTCFFDSENFKTTLKFINSFPDEVPWPSDEAVNLEIFDRRRSGMQMLNIVLISNLFDVQLWDVSFGEPTSFVGYPVEDSSTGSTFVPSPARLAISSTCKNKEAAWEFVRQTILQKFDNASDTVGTERIPLNLSDYQMLTQALMDPNRREREGDVLRFIDGSTYTFHPATEEDLHRFENLLYSTNKISLCDGELSAMIKEICGAYFSGDKTLDETCDLIQRRVKLYIDEMR